MTLHAAMGAAATLVAIAFALSTWERWCARRRRHELAWSISLALFAAGSAALWAGGALGWEPWSFRAFYLFGAILNVPFLAVGTIYLLGGAERGDRAGVAVALLAAFCTGVVVTVPLTGSIDPEILPRGSEVFGLAPRLMAGIGSGVAAVIVLGGALWSAWRLLRGQRRPGEQPTGSLSPRRLAAANLAIAAGTIVLSAGGLLNSVVDEMTGFAISLLVGITLIFGGFLITSGGSSAGTLRSVPDGVVRSALEAAWAREQRRASGD